MTDARRHWLRARRQAELLSALEKQAGRSTRIGYSFGAETLPSRDIARVYDTLAGARA